MSDKVTRTYQFGIESFYDSAGRRHNDNGNPSVVDTNTGTKEWHVHGHLHRDGGPALDGPKVKAWYRNGRLHREDGPAIEEEGGEAGYYLNGEKVDKTALKNLQKAPVVAQKVEAPAKPKPKPKKKKAKPAAKKAPPKAAPAPAAPAPDPVEQSQEDPAVDQTAGPGDEAPPQ